MDFASVVLAIISISSIWKHDAVTNMKCSGAELKAQSQSGRSSPVGVTDECTRRNYFICCHDNCEVNSRNKELQCYLPGMCVACIWLANRAWFNSLFRATPAFFAGRDMDGLASLKWMRGHINQSTGVIEILTRWWCEMKNQTKVHQDHFTV